MEEFENVEVVKKNEIGDWKSMFWRFEPASEEDVDIFISRDTDSRISLRERHAVDEWEASDLTFHIMRDHPYHQFPILGGMWGAKKGTIPNIKKLIEGHGAVDKYGTDYEFFMNVIQPIISPEDVMIHDEFFFGRGFPSKREGLDFVGRVFDENDNPVEEHDQALERVINASSNELYLHTHLGLGDHIDCNGMTRLYLNDYRFDKVHVFAKKKYFSLIEFMYRDEPKIEVIEIPGANEYEEIKEYMEKASQDKYVKFLRIGHENYPWGKEKELKMGCAEIFYKQVGLNYKERFNRFHFEREPAEENRLLKKLNPEGQEYVFVHDDSARGFEITEEKIKEFCSEDVKIIRNDMSENLFHFCELLENAKQIHCMESCFRSLVETLDTKGKLYFHNFRDGASSYLGNSTQKEWKEVTW